MLWRRDTNPLTLVSKVQGSPPEPRCNTLRSKWVSWALNNWRREESQNIFCSNFFSKQIKLLVEFTSVTLILLWAYAFPAFSWTQNFLYHSIFFFNFSFLVIWPSNILKPRQIISPLGPSKSMDHRFWTTKKASITKVWSRSVSNCRHKVNGVAHSLYPCNQIMGLLCCYLEYLKRWRASFSSFIPFSSVIYIFHCYAIVYRKGDGSLERRALINPRRIHSLA